MSFFAETGEICRGKSQYFSISGVRTDVTHVSKSSYFEAKIAHLLYNGSSSNNLVLKPQFSVVFAVFGATTGYAIFPKHKTFKKLFGKILKKQLKKKRKNRISWQKVALSGVY